MEKVNTFREVNYFEYIFLRYNAQKSLVQSLDFERAHLVQVLKTGNPTPKKEKDYRNKLKLVRFELRKAKEELKIRKSEFLALINVDQQIIN